MEAKTVTNNMLELQGEGDNESTVSIDEPQEEEIETPATVVHEEELDQFNDIFLIIEGRRLAVSKVVLCLASPVFRTKFEGCQSPLKEMELTDKKYEHVQEFYSCINPKTMVPVTDKNVYIVLPLLHEYKVEPLMKICKTLLPGLVNEYTDGMELFRHLELAITNDLDELETECIGLCSEMKLADMTKWIEHYNIPLDVQLKVQARALRRLELETEDTHVITGLFGTIKESSSNQPSMANKIGNVELGFADKYGRFRDLLKSELQQNQFADFNRPVMTPQGFAFAQPASVQQGQKKKPVAFQPFQETLLNALSNQDAKKGKISKALQGMRLMYKYLPNDKSLKREAVQFIRSQINSMTAKEKEIFELLPAVAKHDVRGRLVIEIPDGM